MKERLEVSPQRRPLTEAAVLVFKGLKEMGSETSPFFVWGEIVANNTPDGEGHADESWVVHARRSF